VTADRTACGAELTEPAQIEVRHEEVGQRAVEHHDLHVGVRVEPVEDRGKPRLHLRVVEVDGGLSNVTRQ